MIGQLINEFDNSDDNTLKTFNMTFRTEVEGLDKAEVVIGKMVTGGLRELTIDGERTTVKIANRCKQKERVLTTAGRPSPFVYHGVKGNEKRTFTSLADIARETGKSFSFIHYRMEKKSDVKGWFITKEKN